ncbi:Hypothetical predicted protein [Paramuricea clavata]|uniref:Uncharacterized protein n=1 Tax=Paramuricea clavata TaxID=317549 RepID=A0A7D9DQX5_PARCT|nr:Hypothetical predicted protein [Paramuricea clavata]
MAMYALAITPLIKRLKEQAPNASQVWFADDSSAAGRLRALRVWWQRLTILGPEFGYFPNASKTTMVVKEEFFDQAKDLFKETGIKITTDGHKILGAACIVMSINLSLKSQIRAGLKDTTCLLEKYMNTFCYIETPPTLHQSIINVNY